MKREPSTFTGDSDAAPARLNELATDWLSRRDRGLSAEEERELQTWLDDDPRHAAAFEALQPAWAAANGARLAGRGAELRREVAARVAHNRRRRVAAASALVAMTAVLVFAFHAWRAADRSGGGPTIALHPDSQVLPDGSTIELNLGAEVAVDFLPEQRNVRLVRGEALFHVAKDATRPFVVTAGAVSVRAVGTAFAVRLEPKLVNVLVTEGLVSVERGAHPSSASDASAPPTTPAAPVKVSLAAGRRLSLPQEATASAVETQPMSSAEMAQALAWRNRRVEFNGTPLAEAVDMFNRGNAVQLVVANAATGDLRISGVFWTNDSEAFSRVIETSLGITAAPEGSGRIVFRK